MTTVYNVHNTVPAIDQLQRMQREAAFLGGGEHEPASVAASVLFQRLDLVDDELRRAEMVTGELVNRLGPVLPQGFGEKAQVPPEPLPMDDTSALAVRLADLAARGGRLVRQLQGVCEAVDL